MDPILIDSHSTYQTPSGIRCTGVFLDELLQPREDAFRIRPGTEGRDLEIELVKPVLQAEDTPLPPR